MEIEEIIAFVDMETERLKRSLNLHDQDKMVLAVTAKLAEELGEVSAEVLGKANLQRKDKTIGSLDEELADLIITSFILAKISGVDVENSIREKIKKINQRYI